MEAREASDAIETVEPRLFKTCSPGLGSSTSKFSYTEGDHRARLEIKFRRSSSRLRSSNHAAMRRSSQVNLTLSSSKLSDLSRRRWRSLSRAYMVVRATSIRSVSAGERFRWAAAGRTVRGRSFEACAQENIRRTFRKLLELLELSRVKNLRLLLDNIVFCNPLSKLFASGETRDVFSGLA